MKKALRNVQDFVLGDSRMLNQVFEVLACRFVRADLLCGEDMIEMNSQDLLREPK